MSTTEKTFPSRPSLHDEPSISPLPQERTPAGNSRRLMEMEPTIPLSSIAGRNLMDYLEIPFVHWRVISGCFLLSLIAGALALIVWPRTYESEAKLIINVGRESVALDPTATTGQTLMLQKTQEEEINSALEVLSSRQVAELVVDELGALPILDGKLPGSDATKEKSSEPQLLVDAKLRAQQLFDSVSEKLLQVGIRDAVSDREKAIRKVINSVRIHAPKKSSAVTIHAESKTPEMAQALAASITNGFLDRHFSVSRTEGSYDFFLSQTQIVEAQLSEALRVRAEYMKQSKVVSASDMRRILTDQLGAIEQEVLLTRGDLEQALSESKDLESKAEAVPAEIVASKDEDLDLTWSGMRQRVFDLEVLEKQLAARLAEDNPTLLNAREQLAGAREILKAMSQDSVKRSMTPNPVRIRIEEDLQKQRTRTVGLTSKLVEKEKQHAEIDREIDELLAFELKLGEMDRNIEALEASNELLKSKLEEARVIEELQSERISNISIYQPANLVERPASPSKPLVAILFPMLGLMCGCGLALVREVGKKTLRTAADVESKLEFPTLSSIPYSSKVSLISNLTNPKYRNAIAPECQDILSTILLTPSADRGSRGVSIGVISVDPKCGASTVATALAITASQDCSLRTLLVDADVRTATITKSFKLHGVPGLAELLNGSVENSDCIQHVGIKNLELVAASADEMQGQVDINASGFSSVLAEFQIDNDLVVVDLPAASRPDRTHNAIQHLDFVLIVLESEKTGEAHARRLMQKFAVDYHAVGIVLNKTKRYVPRFVSRFVS